MYLPLKLIFLPLKQLKVYIFYGIYSNKNCAIVVCTNGGFGSSKSTSYSDFGASSLSSLGTIHSVFFR